VALFIVAAANIVMARVLHTHLSLGAELGLEAAIVFVGIAVPVGLVLAMLWPEMKEIISIISGAPPRATPFLLRFVSEELKLLGDRIDDTRTRGVDLEGNVVTSWIRDRCFVVASGPYLATDVLVPSEFLALYSGYLRAHADYVKRTGCSTSMRVNVAARDDLWADAQQHPEALATYEQWHLANGVELLHLDCEKARAIARQVGLRETIDFAIWEGELALLVDYRDDGATNLRLALVDETSYRRCMTFLRQAVEAAVPFGEVLQPTAPEPQRLA